MALARVVLAGLLSAVSLAHPAAPPVPRLGHVVVVVFENSERDQVMSGQAPTFSRYASAYADLRSYYAVTHPSLPNYIALVAGTTAGITSDCTDCTANVPSLGSSLSAAGLSWAGYAEGYPSSARFAKKHMPFLYFAGQSSHVHPLTDFDPKRLPAFSLVAPDLCNDAHDCPIATADAFLARFLPPLLRVPKTAVFVIFDEGTSNARGGGHVAAFAAGTAVKRHAVSYQATGHYALLRTIEDALRLPHLGASASAQPLRGIWR